MVTLVEAPTKVLSFTRTLKAPISQVYNAFTERDWYTYWFCDDAHVRKAVGGHILWTWNTGYHAVGTFIELAENQKVAFTWRGAGETADSLVEIMLEEVGDVVVVNMQHHVADENAEVKVVQNEWETRLNNLVSFLETGADLRITERVIIGIYPDAFDAEAAKRLGIPVTEGARVANVIPDLGAAKAGIQSDDVIVELNGKAVNNQSPLNVLVQGKKPGDEVNVTFYRGSERHTVTLKLSGYPLPDFPANFAGLADSVEKQYAALDAELKVLFESVTEEEANKKPAPEEWNAKEVLSHLILTEHWLHHWLGGLMQGPEITGFTANTAARIAGVVNTYKTLTALLAELRRSWSETVAILRAVPAEFHDRKSNLWWATFEVSGFDAHTHQHFNQIRQAITAARG